MKNYFESLHTSINLFSDDLRNAQQGAIASIISHFTVNSESPAIVVMPTGTGKTAVINLTPFLLKSKSVLVITSNTLIRSQIAEEFSKLKTLKKIEVLDTDEYPSVFECSPSKPLIDDATIQNFEESDVVISIPAKFISVMENDLDLPEDFFDLVLVDEAHHVPARTWSEVIDKFPNAKKVFFTATPFRRDKKPIEGKIVYNYPLKKAYDDEVFGAVEFHPVQIKNNIDEDIAIAKKAEEIFNADREQGNNHVLLVRTSNKTHSKELLEIYKEHTSLNLKIVDSSKTNRVVKSTIKKLKDHSLDGVICVDMMGEGFDFPHLKIAAIHKPHQSEAVTLQFIGRFSRTNATDIGSAKFIAVTNEIKGGIQNLYKKGAIWSKIIIDLSNQLVTDQIEEKEAIDTFSTETMTEDSELSLFSIAPYCHVKIYSLDDVDISEEISFRGFEIYQKFSSDELECVVYVLYNKSKPKWLLSNQLENIEYELIMLYYDKNNKLLFINSTIKSNDVYENIFKQLTGIEDKIWTHQIPRHKINRVLLDTSELSFFNIGMQKRMPNSGESYRTLTGSNTQNHIKKTDSALYSGGHIFCKAKIDNHSETIGYSSSSKIWSNAYKTVSKFIQWCQLNGTKIKSARKVVTHSGFDHLPVPSEATAIPNDIFAAFWDHSTYIDTPKIQYTNDNTYQLLDYEIEISSTNANQINLKLTHAEADSIDLNFNLQRGFSHPSPNNYKIDDLPFTDYLNDNPLLFQTREFGLLHGIEFYDGYLDLSKVYDKNQMHPFDWSAYGIDIYSEFGTPDSIHEKYLEYIEENEDVDVIIYDHGTGEMADIVTFKSNASTIDVVLYHAKKAPASGPGNQVDSVYEVCGQAIKSVIISNYKDALRKKLRDRVYQKDEKFKKGDYALVDDMLNSDKTLRVQMTILQPGLTKERVELKILSILNACNDHIISMGQFEQLKVICSE